MAAKLKVYSAPVADTFALPAVTDLVGARNQVTAFVVGTSKAQAMAAARAVGVNFASTSAVRIYHGQGNDYVALTDAGLLTVDSEVIVLHPHRGDVVARSVDGEPLVAVGRYDRPAHTVVHTGSEN